MLQRYGNGDSAPVFVGHAEADVALIAHFSARSGNQGNFDSRIRFLSPNGSSEQSQENEMVRNLKDRGLRRSKRDESDCALPFPGRKYFQTDWDA
jgi:hypothetical protein